ncbi:hypothetical protein [Streptomyces fradiae]|uniref:hypothetical protein n=1 Tax=Streptomyces fradiae TaxID=1906 RepID=UPI002942D000|nr:hypothetical protein [Streptomyces fradiae]WOI61153.1 hypothetical protein RYQ63_15315 [Streptomyces fradiae]
MPGLMNRLKEFTRSPQGRKLTDTARRTASDPRRREQAGRLLGRLRGGRRH